MNIRSLGYRMELAFPGFVGEIIDRGDYLVVVTPSSPTYYWGNYLLFPEPPVSGDLERWRDIFRQEIGHRPGVQHEAIGWDAPDGALGDIEPFRQAGFDVDACSVKVTTELIKPPDHNDQVVVRALDDKDDWDRAALVNSCYSKPVTIVNERIRLAMINWRNLSERGQGNWYGAFLEGVFVAGLGIYRVEDTGVIDSVVTHPDYQRRGVGRTMVYEAAAHALETLGVSRMHLAVEVGSAAERMYEQIGFRTVEQQLGVERA